MHPHHPESDQSLLNVPDHLFHEYLNSDDGFDDDFSFPPSSQTPPPQFGQSQSRSFPSPAPNQGPQPPFPPPTVVWNYTPFTSLDEACYITNHLSDKNFCFIAIPITSLSAIRNDHRRPPIPGYIIHH